MNHATISEAELQAIVDRRGLRWLVIGHAVIGGLTFLFASLFILHFRLAMASDLERAFLVGTLILSGWIIGGMTVYCALCIDKRVKHGLSLVVACMNLPLVPLGTILGIQTLFILRRPTVREAYELQAGVDAARVSSTIQPHSGWRSTSDWRAVYSASFFATAIPKAALWALGLLVVLQLPVLGLPVMMASAPLYLVWPEFTRNSEYVEFWFVGVILKHPLPYLVYGIYFAAWSLLLQMIAAMRRTR